jgi:hypothetical protein
MADGWIHHADRQKWAREKTDQLRAGTPLDFKLSAVRWNGQSATASHWQSIADRIKSVLMTVNT